MSAYEDADAAIAKGGEVRNGPVSDHGLLTVSASLLAIAEAINNLNNTITLINAPVRYVGGDFGDSER